LEEQSGKHFKFYLLILSICLTYICLLRNEYDGKYAATAFWSKEFGLRIEFFGQNNNPLVIKKGVARAYYRPDLSQNG